MAATESSIFAIPSLFQASTKAVIHNLHNYEESLWETPENIKQAILRLMSKRGLITDENIDKVLTPRLRSLDLSGSKVSDECLFKLSSVRHLVKLDLNSFKESNQSITSAGIISLSKTCPYLQIVYLRRNINLTDDAICALSENCPMLRELNVGGCILLTDSSLRALGESSKSLKSLNIIASQVTDDGIHSLCQGDCSQVLTEIDMSGCKHLTDEAVELLLQSCPQLRILLFARCPGITENSRIALEEKLLSTEGAQMKQVSWTIY
ncbi:protein AMN1 homolog [Aplysia californica]|uniref:Protein AMN1 homolog n=1 Tax=Aplysia californica TaxID=6500 RepID=A0ABM0JVG5_APLCA|nr:protein AMN1 homolog [Aplysia californica]